MGYSDIQIGIYCTGLSLYGQTIEYKYLIRILQEQEHKSYQTEQAMDCSVSYHGNSH